MYFSDLYVDRRCQLCFHCSYSQSICFVSLLPGHQVPVLVILQPGRRICPRHVGIRRRKRTAICRTILIVDRDISAIRRGGLCIVRRLAGRRIA